MQGLIHRARLVTSTRGAVGSRNAQGEYAETAAPPGPWFRARLMERGGPAGKRRRRDAGTDAVVPRGYELLADTVDETGEPVLLTASSVIETDCAILGSPTLELDGAPEKLTDGRRHIGWLGYSVKPSDAA